MIGCRLGVFSTVSLVLLSCSGGGSAPAASPADAGEGASDGGQGGTAGGQGGAAGKASGKGGNAGKNGAGGGTSPGAGGAGPVCPTNCDDGNACTADADAPGSGTCSFGCTHAAVTDCKGGDGCCAAGCAPANDSDCTGTTTSAIPTDRVIRWNPGIPGGIPARTTLCATVDAAKNGNGTSDATAAIQAAIDGCAEGQVVKLPAGTYRTTAALTINKGIVLRGDGPAASKILLDAPSVPSVIAVGGQPSFGTGVTVSSGFTKDSTTISLADAAGFSAGDIALIDQLDDPAVVSTGDCMWFKRTAGGARSLGQMVEIASKSGQELKLQSPLHYTFAAGFNPQLTKPSRTVKNAGIEDLYLTRKSDFGGQGFIVEMGSAAYSWVKNVETEKVSGRHIALEACYRCVIRDSYSHHSWKYDFGGTSYGIALNTQTTDSLVENNIVYYLDIPLLFEASGGGNVVAYNYVDDAIAVDGSGKPQGWQMADITTHCSFPHMELVEGNWAPHIGADNVHGGSGYLTLYRNYATAKHRTLVNDNNMAAIDLGARSLYDNVLGNVLLTASPKGIYEGNCVGPTPVAFQLGNGLGSDSCSQFDPQVKQTLLRHGNFDYASNKTTWDPAIASHDLPPSLYLAGKPGFFASRVWPFADPDRDPKIGTLPAKDRFDALP